MTFAMASFTVHLPPDGDIARARFIREGVNIFALIIPLLWLIWNRLWLELVLYIAVLTAIAAFAIFGGEKMAPFLSALPGLYFFIEGNQFVRARLERAGWLQDAVVDAATVAEAEITYYGTDHTGSTAGYSGQYRKIRDVGRVFGGPDNSKPSSIGMFPE